MAKRGMAMLEQFEARQLLSAAFSVVDGTLTIRGTGRADDILVANDYPGTIPIAAWQVSVRLNGRWRSFNPTPVDRIRIEAGAGDDRVLLVSFPFEPTPALQGEGDTLAGSQQAVTTLPATLLGGDGDDTLVGGTAGDLLLGGNGRDALAGSAGDDTLDGGSGSDELLGQDDKDVMRGGRGDDRFTLQGDDTVDGGAGGDLYAKVSPRGRAKVKNVEAALSGDVLPDVFFDATTLVVRGTPRADVFRAYAHFLDGTFVTVNDHSTVNLLGGGVDRIRLDGGAGDDSMLIGPEDDSYGITPEISPVALPLELLGGAGNDSLTGSVASDTLRGGDGDDVLAGGPSNDSLDGDAGDDTLRGNGGNDSLFGHAGTDSLDGGAGTDYLAGGADTDTIFGGPDPDGFEDGDTDSERKDRQPDEGIIIHPPLRTNFPLDYV